MDHQQRHRDEPYSALDRVRQQRAADRVGKLLTELDYGGDAKKSAGRTKVAKSSTCKTKDAGLF
jgi:hypothetical protein